MQSVARVGDTLSHGGSITSGSPNVTVSGARVARIGDPAACAIHGAVTITGGSGVALANTKGIARIGDGCSCGATITSGSASVLAA